MNWKQPTIVSESQIAFPTEALKLMPPYNEIPDEFTRGRGTWVEFQQDWFYKGLRGATFMPRGGIDKKTALRHLQYIQGSFDPKHEHKEAAVAYLASLWFESVECNGKVYGAKA